MSPESEALKAMRPAFLALFKAANERYFARQMGMTVPEWRWAQEKELQRKWDKANWLDYLD